MNLKAKVRRAMAAMANPTKSKTATVPTKGGGRYQYSYESLADVVEIITAALEAEGAAMHQHIDCVDGGRCMVLELFDDEESVVWDVRPWKEMPDIQAQGSWETYTRRYQLKTAFNLVGEDDDGQAAMPQRGEQRKPEKPKAQPQVEEPSRRDYSKMNELAKRYAAAMGMSVSDAANALVEKYGNPKEMADTAYKALLFAVENEVRNVEEGFIDA